MTEPMPPGEVREQMFRPDPLPDEVFLPYCAEHGEDWPCQECADQLLETMIVEAEAVAGENDLQFEFPGGADRRITEAHSLDARANLIEAGKLAGAQSSRVATRADQPTYVAWRTKMILAKFITTEAIVAAWVEWAQTRNRNAPLTALGFDDPASAQLAEDLEALVTAADAEIRRVTKGRPQ